MRRSILLAFALGSSCVFSAGVHAGVILSSFTDPSSGRVGVASLAEDSLRDLGDFPASFGGDTCWLEVEGSSLYASSLNGRLERFDLLSGRLLASVDRPDVQWSGMGVLRGDLLVSFTNPATGQSNIALLDPITLQEKGTLLEQPLGTVVCWLEVDPAGMAVYASSPDGTLFRFGPSGELIDSVSMPDREWSGLAFFEGRILAAYTDRSGGSGGIRVFDSSTLADLGDFLEFPPGHASGPFELLAANESVYASFLDGTIDRYNRSGELLASVERQGVEWRGLAFAPAAAAIPEPSSLVLLGSATVVLGCSGRFLRHASRRLDGRRINESEANKRARIV